MPYVVELQAVSCIGSPRGRDVDIKCQTWITALIVPTVWQVDSAANDQPMKSHPFYRRRAVRSMAISPPIRRPGSPSAGWNVFQKPIPSRNRSMTTSPSSPSTVQGTWTSASTELRRPLSGLRQDKIASAGLSLGSNNALHRPTIAVDPGHPLDESVSLDPR